MIVNVEEETSGKAILSSNDDISDCTSEGSEPTFTPPESDEEEISKIDCSFTNKEVEQTMNKQRDLLQSNQEFD